MDQVKIWLDFDTRSNKDKHFQIIIYSWLEFWFDDNMICEGTLTLSTTCPLWNMAVVSSCSRDASFQQVQGRCSELMWGWIELTSGIPGQIFWKLKNTSEKGRATLNMQPDMRRSDKYKHIYEFDCLSQSSDFKSSGKTLEVMITDCENVL